MSLADSVVIQVIMGRPGITQAGFGVPLIGSQNAADVFGGDITRSYASLADVLVDFPATTPEYNAARALFAQQPSVDHIRIGKLPTNPVTQQWQVTCVSAGINNTYIVRVWNADGTFVTATYVATATSNAGYVISGQNPIFIALSENTGTTVFKFDGGAGPLTETWTWGATPGSKSGTGGPAFGGAAGTITVRVNGNAATDQVITVAAGSGAPGIEYDTLDLFCLAINTQAIGFRATPVGGNVELQSSQWGSSSQIEIRQITGAVATDTGLAVGVGTAGTVTLTKSGGSSTPVTVADIARATPTEIVNAFTAAGAPSHGTLFVNAQGNLELQTATAGAAPSGVQVSSTSVALLGFDTTFHPGLAGGGSTNDDIVTGLQAAIDDYRGQAWIAAHDYVADNFVTNDTGKFYRCVVAGTSAGSGGPTGTGTDITDGTVHWTYTGTSIDDSPIPQMTTALAGSVTAKYLVCTGADDSVWFALEIANPSLLAQSQSQSAPSSSGLATDLQAIANSTLDWYGLLTLYNSKAYVEAAAAWVATQQKLYIPAVSDSVCATASNTGATDVLHDLKAASNGRAGGFFHQRAAQFADAAEVGLFFPVPPGDDNWRMKTLEGVTSGWANGEQLSTNQTANLEARNANYYADIGGVSVIGGDGKVAGGEYIDVVRGLDWFVSLLSTDLTNLLIQNTKIAFDNAGIALIGGVCRADLQTASSPANQLFNPGDPANGIPIPTVTTITSGQAGAANRAARRLATPGGGPGVVISGVLAGAINQMLVNVVVSP